MANGNAVIYNGIALQEPLEIQHHREPQYADDQTDYLCTAHLLTVTGVYNAAVNSFTAGKPPTANAGAGGNLPATTYAAVRHALEQRGGTLLYTDGDTKVLNVFGPDARNGPFTKVHDIQEQIGSACYIVSISILTYMNEAKLAGGSGSQILSHRYKSFDDYDDEFYLTRTIQGFAEFNSGTLAGNVPDQYRAYLFHPCPPGFKMDACHVNVDSDGLTMDYTIVFRQKPIIVVVPGIARIDMTDSMTLTNANWETSAIGVAQGLASMNALSTLQGGLSIARRLSRRIHVRVWGYPTTSRTWCDLVACDLIQSRTLGKMDDGNVLTRNHDIMGRFVEITYEKDQGVLDAAWATLRQGVSAIGQGNLTSSQKLLLNDQLKTIATFTSPPIGPFGGVNGTGLPNADTNDCAWDAGGGLSGKHLADCVANKTAGGPYLQYDILGNQSQGCRGNYQGQLVMAALLGQNLTPARPQLPKIVPNPSSAPAGGSV